MTKKEAFKNWGCLNSIDWSDDSKLKQQYQEAYEIHKKDMKEHPELHDQHEVELGRCYHGYPCKCGFNYSVDSSD